MIALISHLMRIRLIHNMKQSEPDLNALATLIAVVNAGGFSAAARRMGVPANRLSRQVQRLEEDIGVRLLQRTTRQLSLTSAGRRLVDGAEPALAQLAVLWRDTSLQAEEVVGHLRVAAPADFMSVFEPERLAVFLKRFPAVSLEMLLSDDQTDLIGSGFDLAFRAGPIRDESLVARKLASSRFILVASPAFIAAHGAPESIAALPDYPCLTLRSKEGQSVWSFDGPSGQESVRVKARLAINGMGALVATTAAGLGIALVRERLATQALADGRLMHLLQDYHFDTGGFFAVYPSRHNTTAALRAFIEFVLGEARATTAE